MLNDNAKMQINNVHAITMLQVTNETHKTAAGTSMPITAAIKGNMLEVTGTTPVGCGCGLAVSVAVLCCCCS